MGWKFILPMIVPDCKAGASRNGQDGRDGTNDLYLNDLP